MAQGVEGGVLHRKATRKAFLKGLAATTAGGALVALGAERFLGKSDISDNSRPETVFPETGCCTSSPEVKSDLSPIKPAVETDIRTEIIYDFTPSVPQKDSETLTGAAENAVNFYNKTLGVYARGPITYLVDYDPQKMTGAHVSGKNVIFNTAIWEPREETLRRQIIYHEYFHIMQEAMTRKSLKIQDKNPVGDVALIEGMAEYASFMGIIDAGLMTYQKAKDIQLGWLRNSPRLPHISRISFRDKGAYTLGFFAIDFFVRERGMEAVRDYLNNVYELPWKEAFHKTFGMSVVEGYDRFEREWRRANNA